MRGYVALSALLAWFPLVLVLFRAIGPRRAAMVAVFGGFLFLPGWVGWKLLGVLTVERRTIPGLSLALAVLFFDRGVLIKARPRWFDLPMALFVMSPLVAAASSGGRGLAGSIDQSWIHLCEWAIPYAVGRLYFGEGEGPRELAIGLVMAGLAYVPLVIFEAVAGPEWYLARVVYGLQANRSPVVRLGGLRSPVFLGNGLELAAWMSSAAVLAAWLTSCRGRWWPSWAALPALLIAAILCRSIYGYTILALGLAATVLTLSLGTRWILVALLMLPPSYMISRAAGAWDGQGLLRAEQWFGRAGTVAARLRSEGEFLRDAKARGLLFGEGGRYPEWQADGWWVTTLRGGGIFGLAAFYVAFGLPAAIAIFRKSPGSPEAGLALLILLHLIDTLHNTSLLCTTFLGGALSGVASDPTPGEEGRAAHAAWHRFP